MGLSCLNLVAYSRITATEGVEDRRKGSHGPSLDERMGREKCGALRGHLLDSEGFPQRG
jgi:hypothetical protein